MNRKLLLAAGAVAAQLVSLVSFAIAGFGVNSIVGFSVIGIGALALGVTWELEAKAAPSPIDDPVGDD